MASSRACSPSSTMYSLSSNTSLRVVVAIRVMLVWLIANHIERCTCFKRPGRISAPLGGVGAAPREQRRPGREAEAQPHDPSRRRLFVLLRLEPACSSSTTAQHSEARIARIEVSPGLDAGGA